MSQTPGLLPDSDDDSLLNQAFADAQHEMENMVTRALHRGVPFGQLAVVVERTLGGNTKVICSTRHQFADHTDTLKQMDALSRDTIARALKTAAPDVLPIVVLAQREAHWACGIRSVQGSFVPVQ